MRGEPIISVRGLTVAIRGTTILEDIDLDIYRGEILAIVGASGTGKSVTIRSILGLVRRKAGTITAFGEEIGPNGASVDVERRWGVLFQHGALFSSLTVLQNVALPMKEHLDLPEDLVNDLAMLKIELAGLKPEAAALFPSELSGGMIKRAALARALALDPEILFLDEPTSGLDPIGAAEFDQLIADLQKTLDLTVVMVTHDLDSLTTIADRILVIGERHVITEGSWADMQACQHPWVQEYFRGIRARAVPQARQLRAGE